MTYDQDIAVRFKQQFPCCGELDSSGTCCAPACAFGEVMNALGKLKYIRAQSESALRGEQEPKSVLRVIKMNCDHALAAHSPKGADTQREAECRSHPEILALIEAAEKYFALEAEEYSPKRPPDVIHRDQADAMGELRAATRALSQYRSGK